MKLMTVTILAVFMAIVSTSGCRGELESDQGAVASERALVGRLLLPSGSGSRGVEVVATATEVGSEPYDKWILFDEEGRFSAPSGEGFLTSEYRRDSVRSCTASRPKTCPRSTRRARST